MNQRVPRAERLFEWPILVSAVLVIPAIAIEQSSLGQPWDTIATVINWATWLVFLAELVVMLIVVPKRWQWLRHPLELPLVILTPPILPPGLQALRALRLLRLVRLERVARYFRTTPSLEGIRFGALIAALAEIAGGFAFKQLESQQTPRPSFFDGVWWSMSTMTTVGYGDFVPKTTGGRVLAIILMLIGIAFVALVTGAVAQHFISPSIRHVEQELGVVETEEDEIAFEISEIRARLDHLETLLRRSG